MKTHNKIKDYDSLIFRELKNPKDLLENFRLRYRVYESSRLNCLCLQNEEKIDIDQWDAYSRHFGLYAVHKGVKTLAGSIRVIQTDHSLSANALQELGHSSKQVSQVASNQPIHIFHSQGYKEIMNSIKSLIESEINNSSQIVEIGRLVVDKEYRSTVVISALAETLLGICFFGKLDVQTAILTCHSSHKRLYAKYGFYNIPNTEDSKWEKLQAKGSALINSPKRVPNSIKSKLKRYARVFDKFNCVEIDKESKIIISHTNIFANNLQNVFPNSVQQIN